MIKLLGNLVIIVSSLWSRCSIKKAMCEHSHDMAPHRSPVRMHLHFMHPPPTLNANVMTEYSHSYFYTFWLVILSKHRGRIIFSSIKNSRNKNFKNFIELLKNRFGRSRLFYQSNWEKNRSNRSGQFLSKQLALCIVIPEIPVHLLGDSKHVLFIVGKLSSLFYFFSLNGQQVGGTKGN